MDIIQAIVLGFVQGITEWLPISSKSHLIIVQQLFGLVQPAIFDLLLHIGSLLVVLFVFWKDIIALIKGVFKGDKQSIKYVAFIVAASLPAIIIGLVFKKEIDEAENPAEMRKQKIQEYKDKFANPFVAASKGYIDEVIEPSETRARLIHSLEISGSKVDPRPAKKHGIPPF